VTDLLAALVVLGGWVAVNIWLLPRLGVPT